jgi:hypothetical protein
MLEHLHQEHLHLVENGGRFSFAADSMTFSRISTMDSPSLTEHGTLRMRWRRSNLHSIIDGSINVDPIALMQNKSNFTALVHCDCILR